MSAAVPQVPLSAAAGMLHATEGDLLAFLREQRLEHLSRLNLAVLAAGVEPALYPQLRPVATRRRLIELLSTEGLERWRTETQPSPKLRELLPALALRFVDEERAAISRARDALPELLTPPEEPRTHAAHALLVRAREALSEQLSPRPSTTSGLEVDLQLPGFRWKESRASELPVGASTGFILPESRLVFASYAVKTSCSCNATSCVHVLAAIDGALTWLRQPSSDVFLDAVAELTRAPWERTLRALESAVVPDAPSDTEVSWRIEVLGSWGIEVSAYSHRRNKKGGLSQGARLTRRKLLAEMELTARDARLAALLPDREAPATRALLLELVDHPRVQLAHTEDPVRVERTRVGILAEDRGGTVVLTAGIDGTPLPPPLLERVRKAPPDEALYLWEEGERRLTVLEVSGEIRSLLNVLARHANAFPRESHPALLERLSQLSVRVPVAMPRSVMGQALPAANLPVLQLEAQPGTAVRLSIRIRTLEDSPAFLPGEGARDVHVRRGADAFHAVRDFVREKALAEALVEALPLSTCEPDLFPYTYVFPTAQGALAVLAACETMEPRPQLEWTGVPLRKLAPRGIGALRLTLEKRRDWFGVLGGLAVEGDRVELARLLDAARRKERFVQVDATSYVEIEDALRAHLEKLADHVYRSKHGWEVGPSAAEAVRELEQAGAVVESDQAWQTLVQRIFASRELDPRVPVTLNAQLRDYQRDGFRWLSRLASWDAGGILADDMGLGKTVQALTVLLDRAKHGPALVLAPTSVAFNWIDEAKRFAPSLKLRLYSEAEDRGGALRRLEPKDVLVVTYGLLARDIERLSATHFSTIVFDEAQTLKNPATQRFRAARALQGDFRFALSGTPLENNLGELWALFAVVFPGLLGSWDAFRQRFAAPIERGVDPTAAPALARVLQPFMLRRSKAQVETQLPARTDVRVPIVLSPEEWTLYEDARLAALSDLETRRSKLREQERRIEVLAAITRLRLLASHPRLYDPETKIQSSKLERFLELVQELRAEGHRTLVFSQFTKHLALVREVLDAAGIRYEYLDGQTPNGERKERVRAFQEGTAPLFLISLKAGGFGLNLTAANTVIHLDPWWNPAVEDQASDRAHRIGQQRAVTVYRLVARGTIEEKMLGLHEDKRALASRVLEGKEAAAKLSTQELIGLLTKTVAPVDPDRGATRH